MATTTAPTAAAAARGASLLIILQIASRILTFTINQTLLRYLSPELLGVSARLELYCMTVLYFARDSLRVAQQRQATSPQAVINTGYIPAFLGFPLTMIFSLLYHIRAHPEVAYVKEAHMIFSVAAGAELLIEPSFMTCVQKGAFGARARAETAATLGRCFTILGTVLYANRIGVDVGVLPFAAVQTIPFARAEKFSLLMQPLSGNEARNTYISRIPKSIVSIWLNLYFQSGVKYLLTSGDAIVINAMASLHDQGVYALASNYGGLIARMLFQPIEESARGFYARQCLLQPTTNKPTAEGMNAAAMSLKTIFHLYSIIGLAAWSLGPTLAPLLLEVVAGRRWIDNGAGDVLAKYCYYIPLLAVNGVSEAFVAAVASPSDLRFQSGMMLGYSVAFAASAYLGLEVLQLGAHGLIFANCVNMGSRIVYNLSFIKRFFRTYAQGLNLVDALPKAGSFAVAIAAVAVLSQSDKIVLDFLPKGLIGELLRKGAIAAAFGAVLLGVEREYLIENYRVMRPGKSVPKVKKTQ